jgi:hypothetical protein
VDRRPDRQPLSKYRVTTIADPHSGRTSASLYNEWGRLVEALSAHYCGGAYALLCLGSGGKISGSDTDLMSEFSVRNLRY